MGGAVSGISNAVQGATGLNMGGQLGALAGFGGLGALAGQQLNGMFQPQGGGGNAGVDLGPAPTLPSYVSPLTSSGALQSQYQLDPSQALAPVQGTLSALQQNATSTSPSAYARAASNVANTQNQNLLSQAQGQGAGQLAQGQNALASTVGLSPAAAERMATQTTRGTQNALQNVGFEGANTQNQITAQDLSQKQQELENLPGQEMSLANSQIGANQYNIGNTLGQNQLANQANMNQYGIQMQNYGAAQNSNAILNQGTGGKK